MPKPFTESYMFNQFLDLKSEVPDGILLMEMGDFFEIWGDDAIVASKILDVSLNSRGTYRDGTPLPICGIPSSSSKAFVQRLIEKGQTVAVALAKGTSPETRQIEATFTPNTRCGASLH